MKPTTASYGLGRLVQLLCGRFSRILAVRAFLLLCLLVFPMQLRALADEKPIFTPYGFLKFGITGSNHGVDSFGNTNLSAPTTVHANTGLSPLESSYQSSFHVQQSRIGTWIMPEGKVKGQFEIDLIDFKLASATTGSHPRLRIAKVVYTPDDRNEFILGQDWDIFSPLKPFTYNFVGLYFGAGNAGFMRQQAKWHLKQDSSDLSLGIGLAGRNETSTDSSLELNNVPVFMGQYTLNILKELKVGISTILGRVNLGGFTSAIYGVNPYWEIKIEGLPEIHSEVYYGQNLGNSGMLTLAIVPMPSVLHEAGGYVSFKGPITSRLGYLGGIGYAMVGGSGADVSTSTLKIKDNAKVEFGLDYKLEKNLSIFAQNSILRTTYASDVLGNDREVFESNISEIGVYFEF
jgi:hypothetical protein